LAPVPGCTARSVRYIKHLFDRPALDGVEIKHDNVGALADPELAAIPKAEEVGQLAGEVVSPLSAWPPRSVPR
jgi:hypothetical protein